MARPKKFPGTETRSVTFMLPASEVDDVDALAKVLAERYGVAVNRTDAFLKLVTRGKAALQAELSAEVAS
jgi:hypothetical protein